MAGTPMVGWLRCSTRLALLGRYAICINYLHTRTVHPGLYITRIDSPPIADCVSFVREVISCASNVYAYKSNVGYLIAGYLTTHSRLWCLLGP